MRTAVVVIPAGTLAAAFALTALQLRDTPPAPPPADNSQQVGDVSPPECGVRIADLPPEQRRAAIIKPPPTDAPPKYAGPVGDQFLGEWSDLLLAKGDGPPMLFVLRASDLNGRYGWRMPRVAHLMAEELAGVLDDGCASGCPSDAQAARTAARALVDDGDFEDSPAHTRTWVEDQVGVNTTMHELRVSSRAADLSIEATCTCASWTVGMRMWNDVTTCEAVLRQKGRALATYRPRVLSMSNKESIEEPIDAWNQTVDLPGGATLVTETGWEYSGNNMTTPLTKTTVRTGPHWR